MRYYAIKIDNAPSAFPAVPGAFVEGAQFCTLVNGVNDPGALDIEFDIPISSASAIEGQTGAFIKVKGVSLAQIAQASNINNLTVNFYAGMSAGLPLATAQLPHLVNKGLIISGTCRPAFGNWQGNETSLDMFFVSGQPGGGPTNIKQGASGSPYLAKNFSWNWPKNTSMADAIKTTLTTVFPTLTPVININPNLKLPEDEKGIYASFEEFTQHIKSLSHTILDNSVPKYPGIDAVIHGNSIFVSDQTTPQQSAGVINYIDLIGQPTWINVNNIQFKTIVRSDIVCQETVQMPQTVAVINEETAYNQGTSANPLTFQGSFVIQRIRHVGKYRQPIGDAWCSIFDALGPSGSSSGSSSPSTVTPTAGGNAINPTPAPSSRLLNRLPRTF